MATNLEEMVSGPYKTIIRAVTVGVGVIAGFFIAQERAAAFVDERVKIKTMAADRVMQEQTARLEKLDARMDLVQAGMTDIKIDIAKVRTILEKK